MGVFEMVVIIVAIGCLTGVATSYFEAKAKGRGRASDGELAAMGARLAQAEKDTEALRQRVQVLEKLVTDDDHRLAKEIGRLGARDTATPR